MSSPAERLLRFTNASDILEQIEPIRSDGFSLVHTASKIYEPSQAPMYIFDIEDPSGNTIGKIHTILEKDVEKVRECGQICGYMLKDKKDPALLARAAIELESFSAERGVTELRYVIPEDCQESLDALKVAGRKPSTETLCCNGVDMLVYNTSK